MDVSSSQLYTSPEVYMNGPDGMKNEVDMWYQAGALLLQETIKRYRGSKFGGLHKDVGIESRGQLGKLTILDVCCGPGTFVNHLGLFYPNLDVIGIDKNQEFIESANKRFNRYGWKFLNLDATKFELGRTFDFVIASSAYHHIEDDKKVEFLNRIRHHLSEQGKAIFCENFIPSYTDSSTRLDAVNQYYDLLKLYYQQGNATTEATQSIDEVYQLELSGEEEHKVDFDKFRDHLSKSGLEIEVDRVVWQPTQFQKSNAGSHVLLLRGV